MARRGGALSVSCTSADFQELYARTRNWDAVLKRQLRSQLHAAARPVAMEAKANARALRLPASPPSSRRQEHRSTGLRRGIANGVRVVQRNTVNGVEFRFRASHPISRPTNASDFRHPTFGRRGRGQWVTQLSERWWDLAMYGQNARYMSATRQALLNAIDEV